MKHTILSVFHDGNKVATHSVQEDVVDLENQKLVKNNDHDLHILAHMVAALNKSIDSGLGMAHVSFKVKSVENPDHVFTKTDGNEEDAGQEVDSGSFLKHMGVK